MELHNLENKPQGEASTINQPVVLVRNAHKHYGFRKDSLIVLDGLNMTVPKGVIYGLLGASGCGKTTLLNCILGQKKLNSGEIQVLGNVQGTKRNLCGTEIGYMPQETGLYGDFTVEETLLYFGWITGMNKNQIKEKTETLLETFSVPKDRVVKTLSGGEQRRVSLISALLHDPQLLVLDEPTVGVDPLLRENIWNHMKYLARVKGVTIIITTHYIEETRQADIIALMRGGKLLAEESPYQLLARYESESLEEIFLKLSIKQDDVGNNQNEAADDLDQQVTPKLIKPLIESQCCGLNFEINDRTSSVKLVRMRALIWKNMVWWMRNIPAFIYTVALSALTIILFWFSIGMDPHDLPLAVINYETNNTISDYSLTCDSTQLSCYYLERLRNRSVILMNYNSEENARESVLHGDTYGYMVIPHNYSAALRSRMKDYLGSSNIRFSIIDVIWDNSNTMVSYHLKRVFYEEFQHFVKDYLGACNENPKLLDLPLNWKEPIFGTNLLNYTNFTLPGTLIVLTFIQAVFLTAGTMMVERKEASLGRTFVLGVTEVELLLAHIICEGVVMIIQSVLMVIIGYGIIESTHATSFILILLYTLLSGFCGMSYGLLISILFDSYLMISLAAIGSFFPAYCLCGALWPLEGVDKLLRPFTYLSPITNAILGIRGILYKNGNLLDQEVYLGFVSFSIWTVMLLIACIVCLKINK